MSDQPIPLSKPDITQPEQRLVLEVLRSDRLSMGPMLERFEQGVANAAGCAQGVGSEPGYPAWPRNTAFNCAMRKGPE